MVDAAGDAATGRAYVNFLGEQEDARSAYGEDKYARLAALKDAYDPTNVFALNQNIAPASERLSPIASASRQPGGTCRRAGGGAVSDFTPG